MFALTGEHHAHVKSFFVRHVVSEKTHLHHVLKLQNMKILVK